MIGVEPELADDTRRSLLAGDRIAIANPPTIADGLAVTTPGEQTFAINRRLVGEVVVVSEGEIVAAMKRFRELFDLRIEPSGAVGVAALCAGVAAGRWRGERVGIIISGGNIDAERFDSLTS
jgi:threonine dehydratase